MDHFAKVSVFECSWVLIGVEVSLEAFLMMLFRNWHLQAISHLAIMEEVASVKSTRIYHDQKFTDLCGHGVP